MNIMQNRSIMSIIPFLFIASSCLFGIVSYAGGKANSILTVNLNTIKEQAELILIGNLQAVTHPDEIIGENRFCENRIRGEKFYRIKAVEILKGNLPAKCFLVVRTNTPRPQIASGCPFYSGPDTVIGARHSPAPTRWWFLRSVAAAHAQLILGPFAEVVPPRGAGMVVEARLVYTSSRHGSTH